MRTKSETWMRHTRTGGEEIGDWFYVVDYSA